MAERDITTGCPGPRNSNSADRFTPTREVEYCWPAGRPQFRASALTVTPSRTAIRPNSPRSIAFPFRGSPWNNYSILIWTLSLRVFCVTIRDSNDSDLRTRT